MNFITNLIKLALTAAVLYFTVGVGALAWHLYQQPELDALEAQHDPAPVPAMNDYRKALMLASVAMCHQKHPSNDVAFGVCRAKPDAEDVEVISKWCAGRGKGNSYCEFLR